MLIRANIHHQRLGRRVAGRHGGGQPLTFPSRPLGGARSPRRGGRAPPRRAAFVGCVRGCAGRPRQCSVGAHRFFHTTLFSSLTCMDMMKSSSHTRGPALRAEASSILVMGDRQREAKQKPSSLKSSKYIICSSQAWDALAGGDGWMGGRGGGECGVERRSPVRAHAGPRPASTLGACAAAIGCGRPAGARESARCAGGGAAERAGGSSRAQI